jgi:uncharacterized membrane protein YoaK (UPF0700 family)
MQKMPKLPVKKPAKEIIDKKATLSPLFLVFMFFGILIILFITIPHNKLLEQLPVWSSVMLAIVCGVCLVIAAFPLKSNILIAVLILSILSGLILTSVWVKAVIINWMIIITSGVLYSLIKNYFRYKQKRQLQFRQGFDQRG